MMGFKKWKFCIVSLYYFESFCIATQIMENFKDCLNCTKENKFWCIAYPHSFCVEKRVFEDLCLGYLDANSTCEELTDHTGLTPSVDKGELSEEILMQIGKLSDGQKSILDLCSKSNREIPNLEPQLENIRKVLDKMSRFITSTFNASDLDIHQLRNDENCTVNSLLPVIDWIGEIGIWVLIILGILFMIYVLIVTPVLICYISKSCNSRRTTQVDFQMQGNEKETNLSSQSAGAQEPPAP